METLPQRPLHHGQPPPHPQPTLPPPKSHSLWVLWVIVLLLAGGIIVLIAWRQKTGLAADKRESMMRDRPVPVMAEAASAADIPLYLNELGNVTSFYTVTLHTRVDGQLIRVNYVDGQDVKAGDLLAEIDPRPYAAALEQAKGQLLKDQANLANAQIDLKRYTDAPTTVTQQQIDTQKALVEQDQGIVVSDQGQVDSAQVNLDYCRIVSPVTGRIGLRLVDPGNIVNTTDTTGLAVITQLKPIAVIFPVAEDDIDKVNQPNLRVDALDRDPSSMRLLATGRLMAMDSQIDPTTGTLKLKAIFDNKNNELYPSEFVNARIYYQTLKGVVTVPTAAIQHGPNNMTFVYVVNKSADGKSDTVSVRQVTSPENYTDPDRGISAVTEGLKIGEVVVTDGVDKLQDGTKVEVHAPATQPSAAGAAGAATRGASGGSGGHHHHATTNPMGAAHTAAIPIANPPGTAVNQATSRVSP